MKMRPIIVALFVFVTIPALAEPGGATGGFQRVSKTTKGPLITSATIDATDPVNHLLTITGLNFSLAGGPLGVTVDAILLTITGVPTDTQVQAILPNTFLPGSYVLILSTGPGGKDAAAFNLTIGASELVCVECVSAPEVNFPYAGSTTPGGIARDADLLDGYDSTAFIRPGDGMSADTALFAFDSDLLDNLDSTDFSLVGHSHPSIWSANSSDVFYDGGNVGIGTSTPAR